MPKKWRLRKVDPQQHNALAADLNITPLMARLLLLRGVTDHARARLFLDPSPEQLLDPFALRDMDRAVARVRLAKARGETVMVYGDYDVDGVTATAVATRALRRFGLDVRMYIPHRMDEGYGLNAEIATLALQQGVALIVTVDCGITAFAAADAIRAAGIDLVILDHHEPEGGGIPDAVAVVDPKRPDCSYPSPELAGVGVAAKFAQALEGVFPWEDIDLVTLGTIADVVPLTGENRILVKAGLPRLEQSDKHGIRALIEVARLGGKKMTAFSVGFGLGPRLNAAGRMGSASAALDLLMADNADSALALAQALDGHNRERQRLQAALVEEALAIIEADADYASDPVLVLHKEGWHKGVLGIVSAKLTEKFGRPSVVIGVQEGLGTGSGRSIEGFRLNEAFAHCAELLEGFGGHHRAAGLRVRQDRIADFRIRVNAFARRAAPEGLMPVLDLDAELPLADATMDLVARLDSMAPFGEGNPVPVFGTRRLMVKARPQALAKDTLKCWLTDGRVTVSAVGFGLASAFPGLRQGQAVDAAYTLGVDDWNKDPVPQLVLKDLRVLG